MHYSQQIQSARKHITFPYLYAFVAFVACALFTTGGLLSAQTGGTGAISGAITDPTGAMVVSAQVKITDVATGYIRAAQSNDHGLYVFSLLPPGQYTVEVTKQGFKMASSPNVQVVVTETTVLNIGMAPGAVTETITVASAGVELQTESSELGRVTDSAMLANLPLVTRNFTQIIGLNPGVSQEANNAGDLGRGNGSQDASPAGGSLMSQGAASTDNHFEMNGITINDIQGSWIYSAGVPSPNPDTIQEFKVQTALYDATSGRNAGADVNVITKSGTNEYHATLFEYFRNEDLNANDWFAKANLQPRLILRQNQYGLTAGGPVVRNKFLMFGSWQGTRQLNSQDPANHKEVFLPPLTNDRSATGLGKAFAGDEGYLGPSSGQVNANGTVTYYPGASYAYSIPIAPQAVALFNVKLPNGQYMIPNPQTIDTSNPSLETRGTAFISQPGFFNEDQWMANADYLRSDRNKIAFRYFGATSNMEWTTLFQTEGNGLYQPERFDVGSVSDTFILSPRLVNQFVVGLHRSMSNQTYNNAFTFNSLGMNTPGAYQADNAFPLIDIADDGFSTGTTSALYFLQDEYVANDILSWTKGKHQFTFGGGYTFGRDDMAKFNFEAYFIPLTWEDFLAGQANAGFSGWSNIYEIFSSLGDLDRDWRYRQGNAFIQDDYKVTKRLTLNLGLRFERIGNMAAANSAGNVDLAKLDKNPPPTGSVAGYMVSANYRGIPLPNGVIRANNNSVLNDQGQNTWNPRLGFAWVLPGSDRFVLRGGAGMYHTTTEAQMNLQLCAEDPTGAWVVLAGQANVNSSDANPFPAPPNFPAFLPYTPQSATSTDSQYSIDSLDLGWRPPTTYHYSLGLQSRLPGGPVLDVAYAGARDLHLVFDRTANQAPLASPSNPIRGQTTNTLANIVYRKPYQGFTTQAVTNDQTGGQAWYSSLQASLTQKFRQSLQYQASFTWTRLLSPVPGFTIGSNEISPSGDQNNLHVHSPGYGPDFNIRPLRFVLSAFYILPSPAKSHTLLANTLGGWSLATATLVQDGQQAGIGYNNLNNVYGVNGDRASYAPGCDKNHVSTAGSISHRVNNYINSACFTSPAIIGDDGIGTGFGNTPNGILREPDQADIDLSLGKSVQVHWPKEDASVQFRTDFFNALNHPNFAGPNNAASSPAVFGQITSMSTNPRVIQFSLRYAF
jgi:hypothetical protein